MFRARSITACLALVLVGAWACTGTGPDPEPERCEEQPNGTLDCANLCLSYCSKLDACGVTPSDTCVDDCRTVTEAGASEESYRCVIRQPCSAISLCGI